MSNPFSNYADRQSDDGEMIGASWRKLWSDLDRIAGENITDWEFDFISNLSDRLSNYEGRTLISERQQEVIDKLRSKYL
jgi:hypothetical protein